MTAPAPVVVPARRRDALPTLAIHRAIVEEGGALLTRVEEFHLTLEQREREIDALNASLATGFLVARLASVQVAGFVVVTRVGLHRLRHVARLEVLVARGVRRQGVGRALLAAAIARAEASGEVRKLSLAVLADNVGAVALYRSMGFEVEGRRVGEVWFDGAAPVDDLLMARVIAPAQASSSSDHSASRR